MLLELRQAGKRFGAVDALSGFDFGISAGEVVALVGDNGAGKSTAFKAIAGLFPLDSGELRFEGAKVEARSPEQMSKLGVATVYQDLALCENLDVVANLFLGRELGGFALDEAAMEKRAVELLAQLNVTLPSLRVPIEQLSGGQRQSVAIARAVLSQAKLVLLDEPTAALGVAQSKQVLELIRRLKSQGLAVALVSHNLADVLEVADRIAVLRLGRNAGTFDAKSVSREQLVAAITGAST
ncbi:MAG: ATP-binding cassette domain-containing protein [Myxococcaceae bacterium]